MPETKTKEKSLKLHSPAGADPVIYKWPLQSQEGYDEAHELLESMRWVCHDFPDLRVAVENYILDGLDLSDYDKMSQVCDKFNRAADNIRRLRSGIEPPKCMGAPPCRDLLKHIMVQVYNRSIPDPDKLNSYEPFSPQVYGESSYDLVADIILELKLTEDDVFLDLGSGVGNVVLQVAAAANCTCYGIEKNEIPSEYAKYMEDEFLQWMDWYGKACGDFELFHGDFLEPENLTYIKKATVIFVNNFAFGPELNHKLKEIFSGMSDGTRIVSSLEFAPINFKVTPRTLSDVGSILRVSKLSATEGNVSWTDKPVSYFLHLIDRAKLEKYFQQQKRKEDKESYSIARHRYTRARRKRRKQDKKRSRRKKRGTSSSESVSLTPTDVSDLDPSSDGSFTPIASSTQSSIDLLVENYREQVTEFLKKLQTDEFRQQLVEQIHFEKQQKKMYTSKVAELENKIRDILTEGANSIRKVMTEFGIEEQTPTGLSNGARAMLLLNRQLKEDTHVQEERVAKLEDEHNELLQECKEAMGEEAFTPVANRLGAYLTCPDPKLLDWNSPFRAIPSLPVHTATKLSPPSVPLTHARKRARVPNKKLIRIVKSRAKLAPATHSSPPPLDTHVDPPEQMDTTAAEPPLPHPTNSTDPVSSPLASPRGRKTSELGTITISSSPSPPHESSFSIESITRPAKERGKKEDNTTLIPSPGSHTPPSSAANSTPSQRPSLLPPRAQTYLHPFFPFNTLYSQFVEKSGVPYPFYPIALTQQQISMMNMYYPQLSPDKLSQSGSLPHMPITSLPAFNSELARNAPKHHRQSGQKRPTNKRKLAKPEGPSSSTNLPTPPQHSPDKVADVNTTDTSLTPLNTPVPSLDSVTPSSTNKTMDEADTSTEQPGPPYTQES